MCRALTVFLVAMFVGLVMAQPLGLDDKCPRFEKWDYCMNAACTPLLCRQRDLPRLCSLVKECIPGCLCQDGYLRAESGECVPKEECTASPQRF